MVNSTVAMLWDKEGVEIEVEVWVWVGGRRTGVEGYGRGRQRRLGEVYGLGEAGPRCESMADARIQHRGSDNGRRVRFPAAPDRLPRNRTPTRSPSRPPADEPFCAAYAFLPFVVSLQSDFPDESPSWKDLITLVKQRKGIFRLFPLLFPLLLLLAFALALCLSPFLSPILHILLRTC